MATDHVVSDTESLISESAEEIGQKHPPDWRLFAFSRRSSAPIAQLLDAQIEPQHSGDKRSSVAPLLRGSDETTERVKRRKCLATNAAAAAALSSDSPVHEQEDKEHVPSQASVPFSFLHKHNYTLETVIVDGPHETMFELLQLARQRNVRHCSLTRLDLGTTILPPEDLVLNRLLQRIDSNHKKSTKCKGEALWLWFVDRLFGALAPRKNGAPMTFLLLDATIASLLELPTLQRLLLLPHTLGYGLAIVLVGLPRYLIEALPKPTLYVYVSPQPAAITHVRAELQSVPLYGKPFGLGQGSDMTWFRYLATVLCVVSRDPVWFFQIYQVLTRYVMAAGNNSVSHWIATIKPLWSTRIFPFVRDARHVQIELFNGASSSKIGELSNAAASSKIDERSNAAATTNIDECKEEIVYLLATLSYPTVSQDSKTPSPLFFKPRRVSMEHLHESLPLKYTNQWAPIQTHLQTLDYLKIEASFIEILNPLKIFPLIKKYGGLQRKEKVAAKPLTPVVASLLKPNVRSSSKSSHGRKKR